jgi:hypothetical protein
LVPASEGKRRRREVAAARGEERRRRRARRGEGEGEGGQGFRARLILAERAAVRACRGLSRPTLAPRRAALLWAVITGLAQ